MRMPRTALALLAFVLWAGTTSPALGTSASFDVRRVTGSPIFDLNTEDEPDLSGRYLAYEKTPFMGTQQVWVHDRLAGTHTQVNPSGGTQRNPSVWNGILVYEDDDSGTWDIRINQLRTGGDSLLASGAGDQTDPEIQDNVVVWHSGTAVYFKNLQEGVTHQAPIGTGSQGKLGTSLGYIYYQDTDAISPDVYRYDWAWDDDICLSGNLTGMGNWAGDLAVHDDTVLWRANRFAWPNTAIASYDVRSGIESTAADSLFERQQPDVFGKAFAYVDDTSGAIGVRARIEGWSAGSVFSTPTAMEHPSIYGNSVAFDSGSDVWIAERTATTVRVAGADRYATAAQMSARHFAKSTDVVLASGENWPDALCAVGVAGALDCPVLLVRKDSIPDVTKQEITRLGANRFLIVGGTAAVGTAVSTTLDTEFDAEWLQRAEGADRYDTAGHAAAWVYDITTDGPTHGTWFGAAIIVNGENYADALAAAPLSAAQHMPILLARPSELPSATAAELAGDMYRSALFVGGFAAVGEEVQEAADVVLSANPGYQETGRWWGADRYATAAQVADHAVMSHWLDLDALGLATGTGYADALGAGAALGSYGSPVLLTAPQSLSPAASAFLDTWAYEIGEVQVAGGTSAVSDTVMTDVAGELLP